MSTATSQSRDQARVAELEQVLRSVAEQFRRFGNGFPDGFDSRVFRWVEDAIAGAHVPRGFAPTADDERHAPEYGNAREQLAACADWLGYQDEDLSAGLRSPEDGLRLWRFFQERPASLPEMADEEEPGFNVASACKAALGYDPLRGD